MIDHLGIPTVYKMVRFRSRLEARWACFFDLTGIAWQYEPIDLAGYIPDFVVSGTLLVEIKPALGVEQIEEVWRDKIERSGWERDAAIVGTGPRVVAYMEQRAGKPTKRGPGEPSVCWVDGFFGRLIRDGRDGRKPSDVPTIYPETTGQYAEGGERLMAIDPDHLDDLWAVAGNVVQYVARRAETDTNEAAPLAARKERPDAA